MRKIIALFLCPIALSAEIQVGTSEADLLKEKGKPSSVMVAPNTKIYSYPDSYSYHIRGGVISKITKHVVVEPPKTFQYKNKTTIIVTPSTISPKETKDWGFEFTEVDVSFSIRELSDEVRFYPKINFRVKNTSKDDLRFMQVKLVFATSEKDNPKIQGTDTEIVVSRLDIPLAPNVSSAEKTLELHAGYTYLRTIEEGHSYDINFTESFNSNPPKIDCFVMKDGDDEWQYFTTIIYKAK